MLFTKTSIFSGPTAPYISSVIPTLRHDEDKLELECISTGIPEPNVKWRLNGTVINDQRSDDDNMIKFKIETEREVLSKPQNETNTYRLATRIIITDWMYPFSIQCFAKNEVGEAYSETIHALTIEGKVEGLR